MRLLVTGANGFLGQAVVASAVAAGAHEVNAIVRPASPAPLRWKSEPAITVVRADVRDISNWTDALENADVVIHLAAAFGDFFEQFATTVVGTEKLLGAMAAAGVDKMVLISTFSLYDYGALDVGDTLDESSPLVTSDNDRDDYTKTKLLQENLVREASWLRSVIVRPGAIYGRNKLWDAGLAARISDRVGVAIGPHSTQKLTYVENCAEAIVMAAEQTDADGQIINIVDDDLPDQRRFAAALRAAGATDIPESTVAIPYRFAHLFATAVAGFDRFAFAGRGKFPGLVVPSRLDAEFKPLRYSNECAKRVLGWTPRYSLAEGLKRSVRPVA